MEYEKLNLLNTHSIDSRQTLHDADTGRVVAVFYNDYDLDDVLKQLEYNTTLHSINRKLIQDKIEINQKNEILKNQLLYLIDQMVPKGK